MRTEAYSVGFDTRNYKAPIPEGYSESEILTRRERNISDNIIRYLGEYRLGVKFDEISYSIKTNGEETYLESPHADPGPILNIYKKAIAYRQERGLSVNREVAECLGFQKLQDGLADAPIGTMAMWVSRPGSKEEGYGTHSFTFLIQVVEDQVEGKSLRVIPYRNEQSIEEQKRNLMYFDENAQNYNSDIDLLANPTIIQQSDSIQDLDDVIAFIGEEEKFNIAWRENITFIMPLVRAYIEMARSGAPDEELLKARYTIENIVLEKKDVIQSQEKNSTVVLDSKPQIIFERYGSYAPPVAGGSCGSSSSVEIGALNNFLLQDKYGPRTFDCPQCGETNLRPENELLSNCQHCGTDQVSCCDTGNKQSSMALSV